MDTRAEIDAIVERARTQYRTVSDMVTSVIREGILSAAFRPGEHLRQDELARQLDVSRMPVRSALLQLESEGLVNFHPHRGAIVSELDADKVREIYEVRSHLERLAIEKSIRNLTEERLENLQRLADRLDAERDGDQFVRLRIEFYDLLYDKVNNPLLVGLIQRLRSDVGRYWLRLRVATSDGHDTGHRELLNLVAAGDIENAQQYLHEHLERVRDRLSALIDSSRTTTEPV
jgi:DNA-binding GntR family transcriptional regulator